MQSIDDILRVMLYNIGVGEDGDPVALATFGGLDAIHGETSGETGDSTEYRLECLGKMMRHVVLEDWSTSG